MKFNYLTVVALVFVAQNSFAMMFGPSTSGGTSGRQYLFCDGQTKNARTGNNQQINLKVEVIMGEGIVSALAIDGQMSVYEAVERQEGPKGVAYTGKQIQISVPQPQTPNAEGKITVFAETKSGKFTILCRAN